MSPTVSVLVPLGQLDEHRARAWSYVEAHYRRSHASWQLVTGECDDVAWSKGEALRRAYSASSGDVLVIADADSLVDAVTLEKAVRLAPRAPWVVPHTTVYRLTPDETTKVYAGGPLRRGPRLVVRTPYTGPAGGGIVVLTREAWETVNGIDERFEGWGGEDISFGYALATLVGWYERLGGRLFHLWHPHPAPDLRGSPASETLVARYKAARSDPDAMRALIDERRHA